jgi:2-C-methyl-D-erythritol 4-phosphate cytidylyltransferase
MNPEEGDRRDWTLGVAVPAAGEGRRMGGVRKPFLELRGEPLLLHALRPFLDHPLVAGVVVALGEEDALDPPGWLRALDPRVGVVPGGRTRGDSVRAAIRALPRGVDLVAIHDAARPLVTRAILDRCVDAVRPDRGVVAGWPAVDTLKRVKGEGTVAGTLVRREIWHAHTPQVFPREMIIAAYEAAAEAGVDDTDDAALVERMGGNVVMVPGGPWNLKVTRPEDLALAEFLLGGGVE